MSPVPPAGVAQRGGPAGGILVVMFPESERLPGSFPSCFSLVLDLRAKLNTFNEPKIIYYGHKNSNFDCIIGVICGFNLCWKIKCVLLRSHNHWRRQLEV